jgi:hypothetical protein
MSTQLLSIQLTVKRRTVWTAAPIAFYASPMPILELTDDELRDAAGRAIGCCTGAARRGRPD